MSSGRNNACVTSIVFFCLENSKPVCMQCYWNNSLAWQSVHKMLRVLFFLLCHNSPPPLAGGHRPTEIQCFFSASSVILQCFFSASLVLFQCFFIASSVLLQCFSDAYSVLLQCFLNASSVLLQCYFSASSVLLRWFFSASLMLL